MVIWLVSINLLSIYYQLIIDIDIIDDHQIPSRNLLMIWYRSIENTFTYIVNPEVDRIW